MLLTKYQDSMPCGFRPEDFFDLFPISAYVKHVTPGGGGGGGGGDPFLVH